MQVKKNPSKNLNKNRILYFQVALCIVLALLLISVEWKTYANPEKPPTVVYTSNTFEEVIFVKLPESKPEKIKQKKVKLIDEYIISKIDDPSLIDIPEIKKPVKKFDPNAVFKVLDTIPDKAVKQISFEIVEDVPIFPGCEVYKDNDERKACMSRKLSKFIGKKFNTNLASELGLNGDQVIFTQFNVTHTGEVKFIDARASHPKLYEEAKRVLELLPKMKPGMQRLKPVDVIFGLPIRFNIVD
jgi:protein TonB